MIDQSAPLRWAAIAAIGAALFGLGWLQGAHHEQIKGERFEAATEALGKAAAARVAAAHARQLDALTGANHDLVIKYRQAADNAVRNYFDRTRWLQPDPGRRVLPGTSPGEPGDDAAGGERMAACRPDRDFLAACARDAARLDVWREWAVANGLPVR